MRYLSVCSGIEAATVAWQPLGWQPVGFSEIAPFPRAVLRHRWPDVPLHGDFTKIEGIDLADGILVGGTPCQSFSLAGLRAGMADQRGALALQFLRLAHRSRARWVVWENVPGALSTGRGRDFSAIVSGMAELGYGVAWRVLDALYFGIPQRRRRLFVVGYLGDWRPAVAALFERPGSAWHIEARGARGMEHSGGIEARLDDNRRAITMTDGFPFCGTLSDGAHRGGGTNGQDAKSGRVLPVIIGEGAEPNAARRLSPIECERLMGLPDNYTAVPYKGRAADDCPWSPRYTAIANSFAVPVLRWIGERIEMVESIMEENGNGGISPDGLQIRPGARIAVQDALSRS